MANSRSADLQEKTGEKEKKYFTKLSIETLQSSPEIHITIRPVNLDQRFSTWVGLYLLWGYMEIVTENNYTLSI